MLALPPYELKDEDTQITKEQFCLKLADLVSDILECGDKELETLEIRWKKGGASTFRVLFKTNEGTAKDGCGENRQSTTSVTGTADCGTDAVGVAAAAL